MVQRVVIERVITERRVVMLDVDDYDYVKAGQKWINDHSNSAFDDLPEHRYEPYHEEMTPYCIDEG